MILLPLFQFIFTLYWFMKNQQHEEEIVFSGLHGPNLMTWILQLTQHYYHNIHQMQRKTSIFSTLQMIWIRIHPGKIKRAEGENKMEDPLTVESNPPEKSIILLIWAAQRMRKKEEHQTSK